MNPDELHGVRRTTIKVPKRINHKLHFWLTLFTGGAWGFVWAGLAIAKPSHKTEITTAVESYRH